MVNCSLNYPGIVICLLYPLIFVAQKGNSQSWQLFLILNICNSYDLPIPIFLCSEIKIKKQVLFSILPHEISFNFNDVWINVSRAIYKVWTKDEHFPFFICKVIFVIINLWFFKCDGNLCSLRCPTFNKMHSLFRSDISVTWDYRKCIWNLISNQDDFLRNT